MTGSNFGLPQAPPGGGFQIPLLGAYFAKTSSRIISESMLWLNIFQCQAQFVCRLSYDTYVPVK